MLCLTFPGVGLGPAPPFRGTCFWLLTFELYFLAVSRRTKQQEGHEFFPLCPDLFDTNQLSCSAFEWPRPSSHLPFTAFCPPKPAARSQLPGDLPYSSRVVVPRNAWAPLAPLSGAVCNVNLHVNASVGPLPAESLREGGCASCPFIPAGRAVSRPSASGPVGGGGPRTHDCPPWPSSCSAMGLAVHIARKS